MQPEYLARLTKPVQDFIHEVEGGAGIEVQVIPDPNLNKGGPTGQGNLEIIIKAHSIQLLAPTNGYFPDGAVRHEVLHVQRFLVNGVPKLTLSDAERWNKNYSDELGALDNAIEHIVIVPVELQLHPERREHWEAMMQNVCTALPTIPQEDLNLAVCLHWTFLRHVLPGSPQTENARKFAREHALLEMAENFADRLLSVAYSKEEIVRLLFLTFPEIPKYRAALEYINNITGTHQKSIP